ncbi:hypothetical protein KORDIASMS9_03935 [Kordia sp. SMS9]|uniref:hypothetical protein n=1 Tax=Kordia sp. SMS9 TaxID=2282170 RepID=UPI000E0DBC83|nr:hypothetical protein [Kordia sp. SMS9]AXG71678.1 hypothetical protein KORDIASMS9_03935 [Kordia sp. SMS9]
MKYTTVILFLLLVTSCTNKELEIQKRSFNLLKSLDSLQFDDFLNSCFSLENYKALAVKSNIAQKYKDEILPLTNEEWKFYRQKDYENFLDRTEEFQIIWKHIKFEEFHYVKNISFGMKCLDGTIFFTYKNELYEARVYTIDDGNQYQIFSFKM